jgi:putative methyltransferase (TIGR04325 family)
VVDAQLAIWPAYREAVEGNGVLSVFHEVANPEDVVTDDPFAQNLVMSYGYVAARAADRGRLSVLDWGGGLGHYFLLTRALLPDVELDYHCRDVPLLASAGAELLPEATFHDDDRCLQRSYDLVLASGSLQYSRDWEAGLADLASAAGRYLFVTRLPVVSGHDEFVVVQHAGAAGYDTEYLGWVLNRERVVERAGQLGLRLVREFLTGERLRARGAPASGWLRGFLFAPEGGERRPEPA